jgi:hypothetical protein
MSLTSRLSNLFSAGTSVEEQRDGYANPDGKIDGAPPSKRPNTMEEFALLEEVDEELKRPPYPHVSALPCESFRQCAHPRSVCWLEESAARAATFSCTPWTRSRPDSKVTLTFPRNTPVCRIRTSRSSDKRASDAGSMEASRRRCWARSRAR